MVNINKVKRQSNPAIAACRYHLARERSIETDYTVSSEILGQGLCGNVVVAHNRIDDRRYAVKTLRKDGVQDSKLLQLVAEVEIHLSMDYPNIAHVKDVYESETSISMVTECCDGGELYASLQEKGVYSNAEAAVVSQQMLRTVRHLHARSIVHRDLKLENFLFKDKNHHAQMDKHLQQMQENNDNSSRVEAPQLKLIDFGFARVWDPSKFMMTACGSAEYVSPDVLLGDGYTDKADLWSIGVIVWMLLTGYPPFHGQKQDLMSKIKSGRPDYSHQSRWKHVSQDAKDCIAQLLRKDPNERLSAKEAMAHPWMTSAFPKVLSPRGCDFGAVCSMQRYAAGTKLRRAALQMMVQQLNGQETHKLRSVFFELDQESQGWISVQDFQGVFQNLEQTSNESSLQDGDLVKPQELFAALDANDDQRIYYSEFMAATTKVCCRTHKHALKSTFSRLDADSNGTISINDLRTSFGNKFEGVEIEELLNEAHPQGNEICYDEFVEAVTVGQFAEDEFGQFDIISPSKISQLAGFARLGIFTNIPAM